MQRSYIGYALKPRSWTEPGFSGATDSSNFLPVCIELALVKLSMVMSLSLVWFSRWSALLARYKPSAYGFNWYISSARLQIQLLRGCHKTWLAVDG